MAFTAAIADGPSQRFGWPRTILFALAAVGSSLLVAAWITNSDFPTLASAAHPTNTDQATFEDRFILAPTTGKSDALKPLKKRPTLAMAMAAVPPADDLLAQRWMPQDFRASIADDDTPGAATRPTNSNGIPLPRSRPAAADQPVALVGAGPAVALTETGRLADRSFLQKLSDMGRGLFHRGPDLAALGYDNLTAVYDISAHAVYLPSGAVLEAHSGMGNLRDDPEHVSVHMQGATPPAVYSLRLREKDFHGVQAIRMTPADGSDIGGRSGLLVHSYMLGPNGDSNGCVSVKDYDRFLKAFSDGEVNRIAVVPNLKAQVQMVAAQNPT
jgi:hypothetical protein